MTRPLPTGSVHDFDFLIGDWSVANRRLKHRWVGSDDWDEFPGTSRCEPRLGGAANVDQIDFPTRGFSGLTLRSFDPERRTWSIWWINSRNGLLLPPQIGGFDGDRGEFYGDDTDDGRSIDVRFLWTRLGADAARWEQAFSRDGGLLWETNWVMELRRQAA
jgi:hypothetical protein